MNQCNGRPRAIWRPWQLSPDYTYLGDFLTDAKIVEIRTSPTRVVLLRRLPGLFSHVTYQGYMTSGNKIAGTRHLQRLCSRTDAKIAEACDVHLHGLFSHRR